MLQGRPPLKGGLACQFRCEHCVAVPSPACPDSAAILQPQGDEGVEGAQAGAGATTAAARPRVAQGAEGDTHTVASMWRVKGQGNGGNSRKDTGTDDGDGANALPSRHGRQDGRHVLTMYLHSSNCTGQRLEWRWLWL